MKVSQKYLKSFLANNFTYIKYRMEAYMYYNFVHTIVCEVTC